MILVIKDICSRWWEYEFSIVLREMVNYLSAMVHSVSRAWLVCMVYGAEVVHTTYYLMHTTYYLVLMTYFLVRTTYYLVCTTYYLVRTTYYLVCTTYYLMHTMHYLARTMSLKGLVYKKRCNTRYHCYSCQISGTNAVC